MRAVRRPAERAIGYGLFGVAIIVLAAWGSAMVWVVAAIMGVL